MTIFELMGKIVIDNAQANKAIDETNNNAKQLADSLGGSGGGTVSGMAQTMGTKVANVASKLKETEISIHSKLGESITSVQKGYMNQIENTKKQFKNTISAEIKRVSEESNKMRAEYISILGIFASIVLAFTGAITFTTSVLSNIHKASIYRTVIITALIGMVVIFVLWLLMDFIKSIHGQTSRKYLYIIVPEVVLLIIILGTVGLFRLDYFREEKETSLFEANIEQNSEIEETDAVLEENIVTVDTAQISNSIESAGQAIKDTAAELSDTIFNGTTEDVITTTNSDTEEDTNTDVVYEEEYTEDEFSSTTSEETTNSSNSKFKVSFN
mgnify:CR=1 FL=1